MNRLNSTKIASALVSLVLLTQLSAKCIDEISEISHRIAYDAYNLNVGKSLVKVAKDNEAAIVVRAPSRISQSLLQMGRAPKPHSVANKSSLLSGMEGYIPVNPFAGKVGDRYKKFLKDCEETKPPRAGVDCTLEEKVRLRADLDNEKRMMNKLLEPKEGGKREFTKEIRLRGSSGDKEILVYTDSMAHGTKWVPYHEHQPLPENVVEVLAEPGRHSKENIASTSDLDAVGFFPKRPDQKQSTQEEKVFYVQNKGYVTESDLKMMKEFNGNWQLLSENKTDILQHGAEIFFGLNPINDVYIAVSPDGKIEEFDLTEDNPDREAKLIDYAKWLKKMSKHTKVTIPTPEMQRERHAYMKKHFGKDIDYSAAARDYAKILEVMNAPDEKGLH